MPGAAESPDWKLMSLGDLGDITGGSTPATGVANYWGGDVPWLTPSEVSGHYALFIADTKRCITAEGLASSAARLLPAGSVLITSRASIGDAVVNSVPMATNQGFINVIPHPSRVHNEFFALWIRQHRPLLKARAHGVTFKEITKPNFRAIPISLPPLPEQRAIADVLRAVQDATEARRRDLVLEGERRTALLQHLFTRGTRSAPTKQTEIGEMSQRWQVVALSEVWRRAQYGLSIPGRDEGQYPMLRMNNLIAGRLDLDSLQFVDLDMPTLHAFRLDRDDLLFNRTNSADLVGKTSIFDEPGDFVFASYLIRLSLDQTKVDSRYLNGCLGWAPVLRRLRGIASRGVSQANISASKLANFRIGLPPLDEQHECAAILAASDAKIAALKREIALHDELFWALLDELMTGRLSVAPLMDNVTA